MKVSVLKVGGNIIDNKEQLPLFLKQFAELKGPKVLIHGGGKIASEFGKQLGIQPQMVNGRRVTDAETLDVVTMVYGGLINKNLVAKLQALGCNAVGLTGADGNLIQSVKRPVQEVDYGFVGDVIKVNGSFLKLFLEGGYVPVIAPLTHNLEGQILNTNADTMATESAKALANEGVEVSLKFCFDKLGVMRDLDDDDSLIKEIDFEHYQKLKDDGVIVAGMLPKMHNAFGAIEAGVKEVYLGISDNLLKEEPLGTKIF